MFTDKILNGLVYKANVPALAMDGALIDAKLIKVSDGKLPLPQNLKAERISGNEGTVVISWQSDAHRNAQRLTGELWP